jgi:MFS family permease
MLSVLANRTYRHLFAAQVIALIGTGMMTVALGLLAFKIAGDEAGAVLGIALAIKMVAYVGVAPVVGGFVNFLPRRAFLVSMDLTRAAVAIALPFVDRMAGLRPDLRTSGGLRRLHAHLPGDHSGPASGGERLHPGAFALASRVRHGEPAQPDPGGRPAHDYHIQVALRRDYRRFSLFGRAGGFSGGTAARGIGTQGRHLREHYARHPTLSRHPAPQGVACAEPVRCRRRHGDREYVVLVRSVLGGSDSNVALALACFGGGSMAAASLLPRLLDRMADRPIMLSSAGVLGGALLAFATVASVPETSKWLWQALLPTWTILGIAYSAVMTPSGRLLRRSARAADRPAVFAAQFALSHACWLLTYPLAGWLGSSVGIVPTLLVLAAITFAGLLLARRLWPMEEPLALPHEHPELTVRAPSPWRRWDGHAHAYVIDDLHPCWP